jgi:hypothetical protein
MKYRRLRSKKRPNTSLELTMVAGGSAQEVLDAES